jgi:hypothetical protein
LQHAQNRPAALRTKSGLLVAQCNARALRGN